MGILMALKTSVRVGEASPDFLKAKDQAWLSSAREAMDPWELCGHCYSSTAFQEAFKCRGSLMSISGVGAKGVTRHPGDS
jgi:hypothetical protein